MIIRIVSLSIHPDHLDDFVELFKNVEDMIRNSPGCLHLELLQDTGDQNTLLTYSHWKDEVALDRYRESDFFRTTWGKAKKFFKDKPKAMSLTKYHSGKN